MNIKRIISVIITAVMAVALSGAGDFSIMTGEGIKKITVQNESIRQITCEGKDFSTNIIGTENKNIELYFTHKPYTEEQLTKAELKSDESSVTDAKLSIDKKELKIDLVRKSKDGKYITILTPKDISIIVTLENGDMTVKNIKGELLLDGKSMDTDISNVSGVINYRNKSGDLKVNNFEGVMDIKTFSGDIDLNKITGSLTVENTSGNFELKKFDGKLKSKFQVGDIKISESNLTGAEIENQSGDVKISDIKGDKLTITSSLGDIKMNNCELDLIKVELSAGDLKLSEVKSDVDLEMNLGDINLVGFTMLGKENSNIQVNFGDISLGFKDPALYEFLKSLRDEKIIYKPGMEIEDDVKICEKNKKCLRLETNIGSITVK